MTDDGDFREIPGLSSLFGGLNINNLILGLAHRFLFGEPEQQPTAPGEIPEIGTIAPVIKMKHKDGSVILIIGRRESGKTVLAYRLMEIIEKPAFALSPEAPVPGWVTRLKRGDITDDNPPKRSTLFIDDLPVVMSSRDYQDPFTQYIEKMIPVVRHRRKIHMLFATQLATLADKFTLDADIVLLKPANLMFLDIERPAVAKWYKHVMPIFDRMTELEQKKHAVLLCSDYRGLVRIDMPKLGMN